MEKIKLKSGLTIIMEQAPFFKTASFGVWIRSGSRYETAQNTGISHFIEHMLFKGTSTRSALDIAVTSDTFGGQLNAYTSKEYTCVYSRTLHTHFAQAFEMICDMITHPRLDPADIETERGIIREEIAMYEDSAEEVAADLLYGGVWLQSGLGRPILGDPSTVGAFTREDMTDYREYTYTPENMVVSVCGRFDREELLDIAGRYFPKPSGKEPLFVSAPSYTPCIRVREKDFEQTSVVLGFPGLAVGDERRFALSVLNNLLGGGSSSRLNQRIREELGLAYSVYSYSILHMGAGLFGVSAATSPETEEQALLEMLKILRELPHTIREEEVCRVKEQIMASLAMGMEGIASRASHNGRSELLEGQIPTDDDLLQKVRQVTVEDVREMAKELTRFDSMSIAAVGRIKNEDYYTQLKENMV
ncbi:MAG: insulinase family protein [Clostridiales bacterium]|nr:insulinase family protein [Clostridiales bacterium]